MAAEDLFNATKERFEALLAPIEGGAGADISYDETFDKVKAEVEKLTAVTEAKVDWGLILSTSDELLSDKGKDFRLAIYYATAAAHIDGIKGLYEGLVLVSCLVEAFWATMGPTLKRPKARANLCLWFDDHVGKHVLPTFKPTVKDRELVLALDKLNVAVDTELGQKLGDAYPPQGMSVLRSAITRLVKDLPPEPAAPPPPPPPPPPKPVEVAPAAPIAAPAAPPVQVVAAPQAVASDAVVASGGGGGGPTPEDVVDPQSATQALGASSYVITKAASVLRAADPADHAAYRLARTGLWIGVSQAPPADNGTTPMNAPPGYFKEGLDGMVASGDWQGLLNAAEDYAQEFYLWLDPHRYSAIALANLGPEFDDARLAVLREVGLFLARLPDLVNLLFNDGTPFADPATKDWIGSEVKAVMGSGGGGGGGGAVNKLAAKIAEAQKLVADGALPDAVKLLSKAAVAATTAADRFRARLAIAELCLRGDQLLIARSALEGLDKLVEAHRLWEWEPELSAQFYAALYAAHRAMNAGGMDVAPEARAREYAVFDRLCEIDAAAALKVTLG